MPSSGPLGFEAAPGLDGVYLLQTNHYRDFATSYFIVRRVGNLLVSPLLFRPDLTDWVEERGGLDLIFVTHRDEIDRSSLRSVGRTRDGPLPAEIPACQYKARFGCQLAVHDLDAERFGDCEVDLRWTEDVSPAEDLSFIHTPGHTPGSACLLLSHGGRRILFCGDTGYLDASMAIPSAEVADDEIQWVRPAFEELLRYRFDSFEPLHTEDASPQPFLLSGGRTALQNAYSEPENRQA